MDNEGTSDRPASLADVAKLYTEKLIAVRRFTDADRAYDVALRAFENAVLRKDAARKNMEAAVTAYESAKAESES